MLRCHQVYERDSRDQSRHSHIAARPGNVYDATVGVRENPGTRADIHKYLQGHGYVYDVTVGIREVYRDQSRYSKISAKHAMPTMPQKV
jgi:hypothetical protein